jgi:alpha,alpha-trehalose phosphorylase
MSLGHHGVDGGFHIDNVTGPDEYSALADDNVFTNLMAQRNLRAAADWSSRHPPEAAALQVDEEEIAAWRDAAAAMAVPWDAALGVHPQAEDFTRQAPWPFEETGADDYPLMLHFPYFELYRRQVVKQADLVLALHLCGDCFTDEEKARAFAYYEAITVRDSSLSASTQAVIAAEVGHLELAYDYLGEAALVDLVDFQHNTRDGLHMAALAGSWLAVVAGFGGLRDHGGELRFAPRLPAPLSRLAFRVGWRGRTLRVAVSDGTATYELLHGEALELFHCASRVTVKPGERLELAVPPLPSRPEPDQPPGREPHRRRARRS